METQPVLRAGIAYRGALPIAGCEIPATEQLRATLRADSVTITTSSLHLARDPGDPRHPKRYPAAGAATETLNRPGISGDFFS